jgi:hypothetical protein
LAVVGRIDASVPQASPERPDVSQPQQQTGRVETIFPAWANYLLPLLILGVIGGGTYMPLLIASSLSAEALNLGYAPDQPVPYSHALHVGELGMDCKYCHTTVEDAAFAAIPPTQSCMNCHQQIRANSPKMAKVQESYATGKPIEWVKVHDLADYAYFNHAVHVNKGVGCVSCHGRVDQMEVVYQAEPLSMGWCLDCHRQPEKHLRPLDKVTDLDWKPEPRQGETPAQAQLRVGKELKAKYNIHNADYMQSCSLCHR